MITDEQLVARLRDGMAGEVRGHHLDRAAAAAAVRTPTPSRSRRAYLAAAGGIAAVAAVAVTYAVTNSGSHSTPQPGSSSCAVVTGVLPSWARAGFIDPRPVMPYVLGDGGNIIAILWSRDHPLNAPPLRRQNNKILWVSPRYGAPLVIHARLGDSGPTVTRRIGGAPGPSIVNMPSAGCWTFQLSWGDNHDTLRLPYDKP